MFWITDKRIVVVFVFVLIVFFVFVMLLKQLIDLCGSEIPITQPQIHAESLRRNNWFHCLFQW